MNFFVDVKTLKNAMIRRPSVLNPTLPSWMFAPPSAPQGIAPMPNAPAMDPATELVDNSMQVGREMRRRRKRAGILSMLGAGETGGMMGAAINSQMQYGK